MTEERSRTGGGGFLAYRRIRGEPSVRLFGFGSQFPTLRGWAIFGVTSQVTQCWSFLFIVLKGQAKIAQGSALGKVIE